MFSMSGITLEDSQDFTFCLFDLKLKKVGCVLLQAAGGGNSQLAQQINTDRWLLAPTDDMVLYKIPKNKIPDIVALFNSIKDKR